MCAHLAAGLLGEGGDTGPGAELFDPQFEEVRTQPKDPVTEKPKKCKRRNPFFPQGNPKRFNPKNKGKW